MTEKQDDSSLSQPSSATARIVTRCSAPGTSRRDAAHENDLSHVVSPFACRDFDTELKWLVAMSIPSDGKALEWRYIPDRVFRASCGIGNA
jgi:hypothetical protein